MFGRKVMVEKRQKFAQLVGEIRGLLALAAVALQGKGFQSAASGRAANAQVYATRRKRVQHAENFSHFQRAIVREHNSAGAGANSGGAGRYASNQNLRRLTSQ